MDDLTLPRSAREMLTRPVTSPPSYGMIFADGPAGAQAGELRMDASQGDTSAAPAPPRRRGLRRRWAVGAVVVLLAVVGAGAGAVWWGNPRLGEGSLIGPGDGMSWANDGVSNTRMVVRGSPTATVSATFSISNDGRLPFTVQGLDVTETIPWLEKQRVTFVPGILGFPGAGAPRQQVTLEPGEQATVLWSLAMACRPGLSEGSSMEIDALRFRVSWWGATMVRELPLELPITFVGDDKSQPLPGPECD